jgi:hypothetical protein
MCFVDERHQDRWSEYEQQDVSQKEIRGPKGHFHNFDDEFTGWLRHDVGSESTSVPFTRPPCPVSLVMLEFS